MIHIHYYIKYCTDHINYYTMLIPPQAPFKIMNEYYCRMMNAQLGAIMQELKQWPPFLLENFMIRLLKNKKSPLFKEILLPDRTIILRRKRKKGLSDLRLSITFVLKTIIFFNALAMLLSIVRKSAGA